MHPSHLYAPFALCAVLAAAVGGCAETADGGGDDNDSGVTEDPGDGDGDGDGDGVCAVDATGSDLPGVTVHLEGDHCTVVSGEGGMFRYRIEIEEPIEYTQPASMGCGPCGESPLVSFDIGAGAIAYNESDVGCCPPVEEEAKTLGTEPITGTIDWPGVQWSGPSDTMQPYGPPFPAGKYFVRVKIAVPGKGTVIAELPITVVSGEGRRSCTTGGECVYPHGSDNVPDPTSCNTCSCDDGTITACTEIACEMPCPDGTQLGTDCAECSAVSMGCAITRTACLPTCGTSDDCAGGGCDTDGVCRSLCD